MSARQLRLYLFLGEPRSHAAWIHHVLSAAEPIEVRRFRRQLDGAPTLDVDTPDATDIATARALEAGTVELPALWDEGAAAPRSTGRDAIAALLREDGANDSAQEHALIAELEETLLMPIERARDVADEAAYAVVFELVFTTLDALDRRLDVSRYLLGTDTPTAADWWLYCVLLRFDVAYYPLYKLNRTRLADFANLAPYLRDLYQQDAAMDGLDWSLIKQHYFWQDAPINHRRLIPRGGVPNLALPHDREARFAPARDLRALGTEEQAKAASKGTWVRKHSGHRDWITADGASGYPAEAGRYHIYVANNCPWCHRVALTRALKGLQDTISMDVLFYRRHPEEGWQFRPDEPGCTADRVSGHQYVEQLYRRLDSKERSVPILYDRQTDHIVSNESSEIIRMLDRAFGAFASKDAPELCPTALEPEIDELNAWTYTDINNGAYKAGFTRSQAAYDVAYERFFAAMDRLEARLSTRRFLCGELITEADVRLFPTIFRFDPVYYTRFRLNRSMVRDQPHLSRWHDEMLAIPAVAEASNIEHCKGGYFGRTGNNIVPLGPA